MAELVEEKIGRSNMTKEEMRASRNRFDRMLGEYQRLMSADPENASYYRILSEHCRKQSRALEKRIEESAYIEGRS